MNKKLRTTLFALFILSILCFCIYMGYDDIKKQREDFKIFYNDCDFFIVVSNVGNGLGDLCYSPYAYLRMKEDNRTGNYCFISPNHKRIYHNTHCFQNISSQDNENKSKEAKP